MNEPCNARRPIAYDLLEITDQLVGYMEVLASDVTVKLAPISLSHPSPPQEEPKAFKEWPELFHALRMRLDKIQQEASAIRNAIDAVEL